MVSHTAGVFGRIDGQTKYHRQYWVILYTCSFKASSIYLHLPRHLVLGQCQSARCEALRLVRLSPELSGSSDSNTYIHVVRCAVLGDALRL